MTDFVALYGEPDWRGRPLWREVVGPNPGQTTSQEANSWQQQTNNSYEENRLRGVPLLKVVRTSMQDVGLSALSDIVEVRIGSDSQSCIVHKNLLVRDSTTAQEILKSGSAKPGIETLCWPQYEAAHFKIYLDYLYTGRFICHNVTLRNLLKLHAMAEQLGSDTVRTALFKHIYELTHSDFYCLEQADLDYGMKNIIKSSVLHRYLIDKVVAGILRGRYKFAEDDASHLEPSAKLIDSAHREDIFEGFMRLHKSGVTISKISIPSPDEYERRTPSTDPQRVKLDWGN